MSQPRKMTGILDKSKPAAFSPTTPRKDRRHVRQSETTPEDAPSSSIPPCVHIRRIAGIKGGDGTCRQPHLAGGKKSHCLHRGRVRYALCRRHGAKARSTPPTTCLFTSAALGSPTKASRSARPRRRPRKPGRIPPSQKTRWRLATPNTAPFRYEVGAKLTPQPRLEEKP